LHTEYIGGEGEIWLWGKAEAENCFKDTTANWGVQIHWDVIEECGVVGGAIFEK
jgi:hypothetical protein